MYERVFSELGLPKNEARIYETLLRHGELSVSNISAEAEINRRNVYDSLNRLMEKGLVFEVREQRQFVYKAVDPRKLRESIEEKSRALEKVMPDLEALQKNAHASEAVYVYRGIEGWKNYMRDILRLKEDVYTLGGKGSWGDPKLGGFIEQFIAQAQKENIKFHILFDAEVQEQNLTILKILPSEHKFLPKDFSTPAAVDVFANFIVTLANPRPGQVEDQVSFTVIENQQIADAYRTWFQLIWSLLPDKS